MLTEFTAQSLIDWATTLRGVTSRQLEQIKRLAPGLTTEELQALKASLEQNEKNHEASQEFLKQVAARQMEYTTVENREKRQNKEAIEQVQDAQMAQALLR